MLITHVIYQQRYYVIYEQVIFEFAQITSHTHTAHTFAWNPISLFLCETRACVFCFFRDFILCKFFDFSIKFSSIFNKKMEEAEAVQVPKKRTFKKYSYRGVDLEQLLDKSNKDLMELFPARARRKLSRGMKRKPMALLAKLQKAKKEAAAMEKPEIVKTHLRDMIILPEMVGSVVGVYNGKVFNQVEIKPEMIGHYLGEFSVTYKPVKHGRPGIGATHSSRFIPLK